MSLECCLWASQAQRYENQRRDLSIYYKDVLAFFWLASLSEKTKKEVEPILDRYHTVDRIVKEQNPLHPKIDEQTAYDGLSVEAHNCISHHPCLRILHAIQMPRIDSLEKALLQGTRNYYDIWLKKRNQHCKG